MVDSSCCGLVILRSVKAKRVLTLPAALAPAAAYPLCTPCRSQLCHTPFSALRDATLIALRILRKQRSSCWLLVGIKQKRCRFQGHCWGCAVSPDRSHRQQGRLRSTPAEPTRSP